MTDGGERRVRPYGTWPSPLAIEDLVAGASTVGEVRVDADDVWWSESRPDEGGRTELVRRRVDGTTQGCMTYCSSLAGAGLSPSRCSRSAVPMATEAGSSMRRRPESVSTASCSSQPSQATVTTSPTELVAASTSAVTRSSTWQNCQRG